MLRTISLTLQLVLLYAKNSIYNKKLDWQTKCTKRIENSKCLEHALFLDQPEITRQTHSKSLTEMSLIR